MSFEAVDELDKSIMLWKAEINQLDQDLKSKEKIDARVYDLYRNNSFFRGLIDKKVDSLVGAKVTLQSMVDYEYLGATREEGIAWRKLVESEFHRYVDSPENWISADRSMDFTGLIRALTYMDEKTGEMFFSREWRPSPLGYSTCFNPISPHRVKSPGTLQGKDDKVFYGIEFDEFGAAVAYHIEEASPGQKKNFGRKEIKRVAKYSSFNWLQLFHIYEPMMPEYPRGISTSAAALKDIKQLGRYKEADLDKNIIASNYVMTITSDEDPESVADMLSGAATAVDSAMSIDMGSNIPQAITDERDRLLKQICQERYVELTGGKVLHLFKGEDAKIMQAPVASQTSSDYMRGHSKSIANTLGIGYEFGTGDFEGFSFSGGQLSMGIHEHGANIRRQAKSYKAATYIFRAWLDEAMTRGILPKLAGADYFPNREAYCRCDFTGAKKVQADIVKIANANAKNLASGTTSRTEIAHDSGNDLEKIVMDRANEADMILGAIETVAKGRGLDMTDDAKLKIITDLVATQSVQTPDNISDILLEGAN